MMTKLKTQSAEGAEVTAPSPAVELDRLTELIIGAAIEVHRHTGPGLLETVYEECLCHELGLQGLSFQRQVILPILYKGIKLPCGYKMDLVVEDAVVLEIKTVDQLLPIHSAQLLTYLKLSGKQVGLLMNFNEPVLTKGLKRLVNHFQDPTGCSITSAISARQPQEGSKSRSLDDTQKPRRLGVSAVKRMSTPSQHPRLSLPAVK